VKVLELNSNLLIEDGTINHILLAYTQVFKYFINWNSQTSLILALSVCCLGLFSLAYHYYKSHLKWKTQNIELEKYIESNIRLEEFAHIASHDLRSPMRTVISYAGLIKKKISYLDDQKLESYLEFLENGAKKIDVLTSELLEFAKVNSMKLEKTTFNARDMIQDVINILDYDIRTLNAEIILQNLPNKLFLDRQKVQRVFLNLLSNSIKFTKKGTNPKIIISCEQIRDEFIFSVNDNGIGIEKAFQKNIFNPFNKLNNQTSYKGTGLGLSMSKKIIELHKGKIWLESSSGKGSSFSFSLPRHGHEIAYDAKKELLVY